MEQIKIKTLPIFVSHYSNNGSILTLSSDKRSDDLYPYSVFDLAEEEKLDEVFLVDKSMSGFDEAIAGAKGKKKHLRFGLRLCVCQSATEKTEESLRTEHDVIVWLLNENGFQSILKIWAFATTEGFYYNPRIDMDVLKKYWNENLALSIPFYDSFIFNNILRGYQAIPDIKDFKPNFLIERSELPFDPIIEEEVGVYCTNYNYSVDRVKTIYYRNRNDFEAFLMMKTILKQSSFSKPEYEHLAVDTFCMEYWRTRP